ncbi:hypothetical protein GCM10027589_43820 [Actinocorallia lasiicapitis]
MKTETFPDITQNHAPVVSDQVTVGQIAALLADTAAAPGDWWHRVEFDPADRVRVLLDNNLVLITWPPGFRLPAHGHDGRTQLTAVIAGELAEVTVGDEGAVERPLRANRVRIQTGDHMHEVVNPGSGYAVTLHAYI